MIIVEIILALVAGFLRGWGGYAVWPMLITFLLGLFISPSLKSQRDFETVMPMLLVLDGGTMLIYIMMCIIPKSALINESEGAVSSKGLADAGSHNQSIENRQEKHLNVSKDSSKEICPKANNPVDYSGPANVDSPINTPKCAINENKLFCELAEDLGFISHEMTAQALHEQQVDQAIGIKHPIGKYLFEKGCLNRSQIATILKVQKRVDSGNS